jgi:uncharacterized protein DUF3667
MLTTTIDRAECPNCGRMRDGAFCGSCGQKGGLLNPTFSTFLHDLTHEFVHVDGKIVQSARLLLLRPGFLSREYFAGRRVRYISPIRLYLVFSVLYFAIVAFAPLRGVHVSCTTCPPESKARVEEAMREGLAHWAPRAMFVLVPAFAALVAVAARGSGRNYPSHLYFAMHVHAAWFFTGAVTALVGASRIPYVPSAVSAGATIYAIAYPMMAFHRAYGVRVTRTILRMGVVLAVYFVAVIGSLLAIVLSVALPAAR